MRSREKKPTPIVSSHGDKWNVRNRIYQRQHTQCWKSFFFRTIFMVKISFDFRLIFTLQSNNANAFLNEQIPKLPNF